MKKIILCVAVAAICCAAAVCVSCKKTEHEHVYGEWETTSPATCTKAGTEMAICTVCGQKAFKTIAKTAHDFAEVGVQKAATCEDYGENLYRCRVCGETKIDYISPTGHDYTGEETVTEPTCTAKGERRVKCKNGCGKDKVSVLTALGHNYDEGKVTKAASCEEDGEMLFTCSRCSKSYTEPISALGHDYGDYVVDIPSTLTTEGQKSRHCQRSGCLSRTDIKTLPAGVNVEYTVSVKRTGGRDYPYPSELTVVLYEGSREIETHPLVGGRATFTVTDKPYKVVIRGMRPGYTQKEEVTLDRSKVDIDIVLTGSVIENDNESAPPSALDEGDPMYDFMVRDVNTPSGQWQKLSDLMEGKKGAYIFFFYVGCGACKQQFPWFIETYNSFGEAKKDLLVVMVNVYNQTDKAMSDYKASASYPDEFYMTAGNLRKSDGRQLYLFDWVRRPYSAVPFSYFLDSEGVIDEIVLAGPRDELTETYNRVLTRYLGAAQSTAPDAANKSFPELTETRPAIVPQKRLYYTAFDRKRKFA